MKWTAYCCAICDDNDQSFQKVFNTEAIPRDGDDFACCSFDSDFVLEMDVGGASWRLEGNELTAMVHMYPTGGCEPKDFLHYGWEPA